MFVGVWTSIRMPAVTEEVVLYILEQCYLFMTHLYPVSSTVLFVASILTLQVKSFLCACHFPAQVNSWEIILEGYDITNTQVKIDIVTWQEVSC